MGKRRKPVRKRNYQSIEDIQVTNAINEVPEEVRMAGDRILSDLQMEAEEENRQIKHLANQLSRYAGIDDKFERAGVPYQVVEGLTTSLRPLSNGVPEPYIDKSSKRGIERRIHTAVTENPYTGDYEIIPFNNPETGNALVTEYGDGRGGRIDGLYIPSHPKEVGPRASEIVGKHAMWLSGDSGARMINDTGDYSLPDMRSGDGRGVDTHTLRTRRHNGVVEIQVNTGLFPTVRPRGDSNAAVRQMIEEKVDQGYSVIDAIEQLKNNDRGGVNPVRRYGEDKSAGKLVKEGYDGLISPLQNEQAAFNNVRGLRPNYQDKQVIAPEKVYAVDLHKVRDALSQLTPSEQKAMMKVSPNRGTNQEGAVRSRVNMDVPINTPGIVDISNEGYVAQMLRELKYA